MADTSTIDSTFPDRFVTSKSTDLQERIVLDLWVLLLLGYIFYWIPAGVLVAIFVWFLTADMTVFQLLKAPDGLDQEPKKTVGPLASDQQ